MSSPKPKKTCGGSATTQLAGAVKRCEVNKANPRLQLRRLGKAAHRTHHEHGVLQPRVVLADMAGVHCRARVQHACDPLLQAHASMAPQKSRACNVLQAVTCHTTPGLNQVGARAGRACCRRSCCHARNSELCSCGLLRAHTTAADSMPQIAMRSAPRAGS
jgi:hypothetical protein